VVLHGFAPQINSLSKTVNFGSNDNNAGAQYFTQDRQTYYGTARLDASLTQKIRLYGSWLYQYSRETGNSMRYRIRKNRRRVYLKHLDP